MKTPNRPLTPDQSLILQFLTRQPETFRTESEIARQADGQARYWEDPRWANHVLAELKEMKLLEAGPDGSFRPAPRPVAEPTETNPAPPVGAKTNRRFLSPDLKTLLMNEGFPLDKLQRD